MLTIDSYFKEFVSNLLAISTAADRLLASPREFHAIQ
jgi:hypothetical protein